MCTRNEQGATSLPAVRPKLASSASAADRRKDPCAEPDF